MTISVLFLIWIFFLLAGMPVFFSLTISSSLYLYMNGEILLSVPQRMTAAANSFPLLAAPFFIFAGNLMNTSGITDRIFRFADALVGHIPGSVGHANVVGSMIFSGMTGAAVADAGGLGAIELKAMKERGYDIGFSAGITAASSTIGPIIPPSVPMVFYGVLAGASIGGLFVAGIVPGILMGLSLMIMVYYFAKKRQYPLSERSTLIEFFVAFKEAFLSLLTPIILIGGILSGIFTPTEAAVVASLYGLLLGGLVYKDIKWHEFKAVVTDTIETTAIVMLLVMSASLFGWILSRAQVPRLLASFLLSVTANKFLMLLMINVFLLFIGCFMESLAALIILVPVLMPLVVNMGIHPVHFGVVMVLNLMIGTLTPPVGIVLYVVARIAGISFHETMKGTMPFLIPLIIVLLLVTYIPELTLFLPRVLMGIE